MQVLPSRCCVDIVSKEYPTHYSLSPVHRRKSQCDNVDPDVQSALVLPDFCFVYPSKSQPSPSTTQSQTSTVTTSLSSSSSSAHISDAAHRDLLPTCVCLTIADPPSTKGRDKSGSFCCEDSPKSDSSATSSSSASSSSSRVSAGNHQFHHQHHGGGDAGSDEEDWRDEVDSGVCVEPLDSGYGDCVSHCVSRHAELCDMDSNTSLDDLPALRTAKNPEDLFYPLTTTGTDCIYNQNQADVKDSNFTISIEIKVCRSSILF